MTPIRWFCARIWVHLICYISNSYASHMLFFPVFGGTICVFPMSVRIFAALSLHFFGPCHFTVQFFVQGSIVYTERLHWILLGKLLFSQYPEFSSIFVFHATNFFLLSSLWIFLARGCATSVTFHNCIHVLNHIFGWLHSWFWSTILQPYWIRPARKKSKYFPHWP